MYIYNINNKIYVRYKIIYNVYLQFKKMHIIFLFYFLKATIKFEKYTAQRKQSLVFNFNMLKKCLNMF